MKGKNKIGVIGCGNMGSVLVSGLLESGLCPPSSIYVADAKKAKLKSLKKSGVRIVDNGKLADSADVIILAVKPAAVSEVISGIRNFLTPSKVIISIAAGVSTRKIESFLKGKKVPVIRVMPNVNAMVKAGILPYCFGKHAAGCRGLPERLFSPLGTVFRLSENMFDAVTALSGSGPGFIFYLAENIKNICREKKFTEKQSALISSYLVCGSGKMLAETGIAPEKLKEMVTSPGGTTAAGLKVFEQKNFPRILKQAVEKAEKRSRELSRT